MTTVDWLWLLHPALAVVVVFPLIGMVVRLAWQTRQRRVSKVKHPAAVGHDHSQLGRWLAASVQILVLIALTVAIATQAPLAEFVGGINRAGLLLLVLIGSVASLLALWFTQALSLRLVFALISWSGVLGLGAQPEVWKQDHYWSGVVVTGLMLLSLAIRPEILRDIRVRRLHISLSVLAAALFVVQGITGSRDLLEIPLSWQQPFLQQCNWTEQVCPPGQQN